MTVRTVPQGAHHLSDDPAVELRALLGSCVAICLHDPAAGIGGMTHSVWTEMGRLGAALPLHEYERLNNALIKSGAGRGRMRASVVGGARLLTAGRPVGSELGRTVLDILFQEGVPVDEISLGGSRARRVRFRPATGELTVKAVDDAVEDATTGPPVVRGVQLF